MSDHDFELMFVVPGVEDAFDPRIERVEEHLDVIVSAHGAQTVAAVTAPGADAVSAGRAAATILSACGLPPVRSYPDLVSRQDIAERADVSRQAVGNWVRGERLQSDPFPEPVHAVAGGVWLWGDVARWLLRQGKDVDALDFPTVDDHTAIDALLHAARERQPVEESGTTDIGYVSAGVAFSADESEKPCRVSAVGYVLLCAEPA